MRKARLAVAALLLASMTCGVLTGCGGDDESSVVKELNSEDKETISNAADNSDILTGELKNKTIKWMANWDINPDGTGKSTPVELETFQSHYGGTVEYHAVDWSSRYDQLANAVNGGEGIDFFPASDLDAFPKGAIKDMFVPIDDYIDFSEPAFAPMKETYDLFVWKDKHYVIANNVSGDNCVVIYNKETIEENGLQDPAKLFAEGNWNWDTFTEQLKQFVDPDNGQFGIDGWWFEAGLSATCGVPYIGVQDGKLVNNLKDPAIERLQNWMYDLGTTNCVAIGVGDFGWDAHPEYIGEGKTLYYPCGAWAMYNDTWKENFGEDAMFVPMPKDPNSDTYWIPCGLDGYCMVKGGQNPEGVAIFAKCKRFAIMDDEANAVGEKQLFDDYGWNQEMVDMLHTCHAMAQEHPYYDFFNAISTDVSGILDSNENGIRASSKGVTPWSESVGVVYSAIDAYLADYNK